MYEEAKMLPAMLIWKLPAGKEGMLSEMCSSGQYFAEEKVDGYWYQFERTSNHTYFFSRTESKVTGCLSEKSSNVPHLVDALSCLPANTILIGEIFVPGGTSKNVTSIMGCLPAEAIKRQKDAPIHYYIHDIIEYDGINLMDTGAEDRYNILKAIYKLHGLSAYCFLHLAEKIDEDIESFVSKILASGGEGAVLKKRNATYTPGKRPAWATIKVKQMDAIDLVCTGFCPATREYTGKELETWDYWEEKSDENTWTLVNGRYFEDYLNSPNYYRPVTKYYYLGWNTAIEVGAYDKDGNLKTLGKVSSGLTDEMKEDMTFNPEKYLGRVVALDCMSIDKKNKTLRHPALKCWRDDKDAKDCVIEELFA